MRSSGSSTAPPARPPRTPGRTGRGPCRWWRGRGECGGCGPGAVVEDWSFIKMIVRVDLTALDRGQVAPGEVCEIAGQGPIRWPMRGG